MRLPFQTRGQFKTALDDAFTKITQEPKIVQRFAFPQLCFSLKRKPFRFHQEKVKGDDRLPLKILSLQRDHIYLEKLNKNPVECVGFTHAQKIPQVPYRQLSE